MGAPAGVPSFTNLEGNVMPTSTQDEPRPANSGSRGRPARQRPPRWRLWVLLLGVMVTALLLLRPAMRTTTPTKLSFTEFVD